MPRDRLIDIYLEEAARFPVLGRDQELEVARRVRSGDREARQTMIQSNLRLVVSVARQYDNLGLPLLDVIEEGNIGLMRAVDRFDPELSFRFSTYAVHWIRQAIRLALAEKGRNVRIPTYMAELVARFKKHVREHPDPAHLEELARALRIPVATPALVDRVMATARQGSAALDGALLEEVGAALSDADPERPLLDREAMDLVHDRLARLPPREAEVLRYRFGIDGYPVLTLEEIGESFDLTRERIRQIEAQAMSRMRGMIRAEAVV